MNNTISPKQMPVALADVLQAGLVPMIHGSPGASKSDCVEQFAKTYKLALIDDMYLSTLEPVDLQGFPVERDGRMHYSPLGNIPLDGLDEIPKGKKGFCLFLDEFNSAARMTQAAAYRLILTKRIGKYKVHPNCVIICAGNLVTDNAIVNNLSTAMQSRLVHLFLEQENESWLVWANTNGIDERVISFIKYRPELLTKFDPKHNDCTFACGRTWEFLSRFIKNKTGRFTGLDHTIMSGIVSTGVATEFKIFCEVYNTLPSIGELVSDPEGVKIKDEPSVQYALTTLISHNIDDSNVNELMKVVARIPLDFQIVTLRDIFTKHPVLKQSKPIEDWISLNSNILF